MHPVDILKRPYARVLVPEENGQYTAEIMEFPGCVAFGDNSADALKDLEEVALEWIRAALEQGQNIPEPLECNAFSGKLVLRMPTGLHRRASLCANREGTSLNQFIVTCLAEAVGERSRSHSLPSTYIKMDANVLVHTGGTPRVSFDEQPPGTASSGFSNALTVTSNQVVTLPSLHAISREKVNA